MQRRSPRAASWRQCATDFSTGTDSPVSAASSTSRFFTLSRRRSAGTLSPETSSTTSPGTSCAASISWRSPSRRTMACGESMSRMAFRAFSALPSWMKPMTTLISTAARITAVSTQWPSRAAISAAPSIRYSSTLWNW